MLFGNIYGVYSKKIIFNSLSIKILHKNSKVPTNVWVVYYPFKIFARPKSVNFIWPSSSNKIFSGFKSL